MSIQQLLVHVGPPKTGSTALQVQLRKHRALLKKHGVLYPVAGTRYGSARAAAHHEVAKTFLQNDKIFPFIERQDPHQLFQALEDEAREHRCSRVLLSSEAFSPQAVQNIREFLPATTELRIVYVARRQDELMESLYSQSIKNGAFKGTKAEYASRFASSRTYDHVKTLDAYSELGHVHVIPYEIKKVSHRILELFLLSLGVESDGLPVDERMINGRLSDFNIELIKRFPPRSMNENYSAIYRHMEAVGGTSCCFDRDMKKSVMNDYRESNTLLFENYVSEPLKAVLGASFDESVDESYEELTREKCMEQSAELVFHLLMKLEEIRSDT